MYTVRSPRPLGGGIRNFHVDHYRPKKLFPGLRNTIENLYYSCSVCNVFKGDDWPDTPDKELSKSCYPDPAQTDYNELFRVLSDWRLEGLKPAARYLVEKLYLNRPQLLMERREAALVSRANELREAIRRLVEVAKEKHLTHSKLQADLNVVLLELTRLYGLRRSVRPYEAEDLRRR